MGLNETTRHMREHLANLCVDLEKAAGGNKAAAQRVRTGTIKLEKTAKMYRKESISAEKSGTGPKRASKKAVHKPAKATKQAKVKARPKAKAVMNPAKKAPMPVKRPTAKLPLRK